MKFLEVLQHVKGTDRVKGSSLKGQVWKRIEVDLQVAVALDIDLIDFHFLVRQAGLQMPGPAPANIEYALDRSALYLARREPISVGPINVIGIDAGIVMGLEDLHQIATEYSLIDFLVDFELWFWVLFHVGRQWNGSKGLICVRAKTNGIVNSCITSPQVVRHHA